MKKKISIVLVLALGQAAEVANADFTFGTPTKLPNVNTSSREFNPSISADGLSLFFNSNRPGGIGGMDIWVATRETTDDPWGTPVNLGPPINTPDNDWGPSISSDGLSLYFDIRQPGASSAIDDIWMATRATTDDDWGNLVSLGPTVNSSSDDCYQCISADQLSLYFSSNRSGGHGAYDLWVTTRETIHNSWATPVNLGPTVNSSGFDTDPSISADGLLLFFQSTRPGGLGGECDIWVTRRATTNDDWGEPVNLGSTVNSSASEDYPNVSADGSTLFFRYSQSGRYSGGDLWQAPIIPIVDFNGDEIVDLKDFSKLAQYSRQNESSVDIGPMPWGDGIADVQDLAVLAENWLAELGLVAHWKLDETEGGIALDSIGGKDGYGAPDLLWRPQGGKVGGALELDGIDDFLLTTFSLNPAETSFSVFAWVKGGAAEQVIVSQGGGANWLSADPLDGTLMSSLRGPAGGRVLPQPLVSEFIITDGEWHQVGFTWDGSDRVLYVDDVEVARDTPPFGLASSEGTLYIGAASSLEAGSHWSGLIDDVRIYDLAIKP